MEKISSEEENIMSPSESSEAEDMKTKIETGVIYCADNLKVMQELPSESIDFIYIDPPFFSGRTYESIWKDKQELASFDDRWRGGIEYYTHWLSERLEQMHRLLKKTGVLAVHLDYHAVHYVKTELDRIFGQEDRNRGRKLFINEIFWKRRHGCANVSVSRHLQQNTDQVLVYAKSKEYFFGNNFIDDSDNLPEKILKMYRNDDHDGKGLYRWMSLQNPADRPNLKYNFHGVNPPTTGWQWTKERMQKAYEDGILKITSTTIYRKKYLSKRKGAPLSVIWDDIPYLLKSYKESTGYPTQKPVALLERLINIFSKPGAVVADFFCGCGTALVAAHNLKRSWIGVDNSPKAARVIRKRLHDLNIPVEQIELEKLNVKKLEKLDPFDFEKSAVRIIGGIPNDKQVGDHGIDGRLKIDGTPIQVKKSKRVGRVVVDKFYRHAKEKGRGIIIALSFAPTAYEQVAILKKEGIDLKLITIDDLKKLANESEIQILERATTKKTAEKTTTKKRVA